MTALSAGASLTRYHSRYPAFDGAKLLLFQDMTKFLTQPQMPINQQFTNGKTTFQIAFQIEKGKTKSECKKSKSKRVSDWEFIQKSNRPPRKRKRKK